MAEKANPCPVCGQSDHVYKISQIYLEGMMRLRQGDEAETPMLDKLKSEVPAERIEKNHEKEYYRDVIQAFQPPQGGKQGMRLIHPDWIAGGMGIISILFLAEIFFNNYNTFWYLAALLAIGYATYFFFRKRILAKYLVQKSKEHGSAQQIERAVGRWMKLHYCSSDNLVFGLKKGEWTPFEKMNDLLFK